MTTFNLLIVQSTKELYVKEMDGKTERKRHGPFTSIDHVMNCIRKRKHELNEKTACPRCGATH